MMFALAVAERNINTVMGNKDKTYSGGFLYNSEKKVVLLHKRDGNTEYNPHQWAFFGGLAEGNETETQAFIREMKEELNINIPEDKVNPLCSYFNNERQTQRNIFFVESDLEKSQMCLGEGADFEWIKLDKVFEYDLTDKTTRDLKFFLNMLVGKNMKTLKFRQNLAEEVLSGRKTATWRLFDDKNLSVDDKVELLIWETKEKFADAEIANVKEKKLGDIVEADFIGHETFESREAMLKSYQSFYGDKVNWDTIVKMIDFKLL